MPLAIVPFNPRGLERRPSTWPGFPWAELAQSADAFAPMVYTGGAYKGFDATYGYVTRALRLLRAQTGADVQIHVAGGVATASGPRSSTASSRRSPTTAATIGVSLYDWMTTPSRAWQRARTAQPLAGQASRSRSRVSSRCSGITFTSASTGMKFVSPAQRGTTWRWTWSAMPAPATRPRFQPRLKPPGP